MTDLTLEQAHAAVKSENHTLADQLRQARSDLHRLGVADQNRVLVYAACTGAVGVLVGVAIGMSLVPPRMAIPRQK